MYNQNDDYLAKRIAEETMRQQKEAYNKRLSLAIKIALCLFTGIVGFFDLCLFFVLGPSVPVLFIVLLVITIVYFKKHK